MVADSASQGEDPFFTVREVAAILRRSEQRIYQMIAARELPATRMGRRVVIPRGAFTTWVAALDAQALASVESDV